MTFFTVRGTCGLGPRCHGYQSATWTASTTRFPAGTILLSDVGIQMIFEGRSFDEIDWRRVGVSAAGGLIGGASGALAGAAISGAGLTDSDD